LILIFVACMLASVRVMTPADALALPRPRADARIAYGADPIQFGDLRLPRGEGPFPLGVLIHGGCWAVEIDLGHLSLGAKALAEAGIASWSIEYSRVGDPRGGWPGTFSDVALGFGHAAELARTYPLDLGRLVVVGHSAGGHLGLWLAARPPQGGLLHPRAVLGLAAITDLALAAERGACRGFVPGLRTGAPLADTSPLHMERPQWPVRLITAEHDRIVPEEQTTAYLDAAASGASHRAIAGAGHFELITPGTSAWPIVLEEVRSAIGGGERG
jgi:acetyl esterase/lipase